MQRKFLIQFGVVSLLFGSLMFVDRSILGITVDILQGLLYVVTGLFAFAAVMRGQVSMHRFVLIMGLIYAVFFFVGVVNHGFVLLLFRTGKIENLIHLVFASTLLLFSAREQTLARWFAPAKRLA